MYPCKGLLRCSQAVVSILRGKRERTLPEMQRGESKTHPPHPARHCDFSARQPTPFFFLPFFSFVFFLFSSHHFFILFTLVPRLPFSLASTITVVLFTAATSRDQQLQQQPLQLLLLQPPPPDKQHVLCRNTRGPGPCHPAQPAEQEACPRDRLYHPYHGRRHNRLHPRTLQQRYSSKYI